VVIFLFFFGKKLQIMQKMLHTKRVTENLGELAVSAHVKKKDMNIDDSTDE